MGIEQELFRPGNRVPEHRHVPLPHHHERLLLEGVEPGDEHVGLEPAGELQVGGGDVRDLLVEIIAAGGHDRLGLFLGQAEDHGDVVWSKAPEDVLFPPDLAEAQAVRVDVVYPPQLAFADELLEPDEGGVVLQEMPHHEDALLLLRDSFKLMGIREAERKGLLHEHVLA